MSARTLLLAIGTAIGAALATGCAVDPGAGTGLAPSEQPSRIVSGQPDAGRHPYVGLLVFDAGGGPAWRCSGALLSPTVVLTAGHCTDGAEAARIWLAEDVGADPQYPLGGPTSYEGTAYTYADFCTGCGPGLPNYARGDVGIVVLDEPVPARVLSRYAQLPSVDLVATLAGGSDVRLVGYGVQRRLVGGGPPVWTGLRVRLSAPTVVVSGQFAHSDTFVRLSANAAQGKGGTCFGDSGGPDLLGGTDVVLAVNSYVTNTNCAGVTYSYRVDTPAVLAWIHSFL